MFRSKRLHRYALNIKKLSLETVWIEACDIEKTIKEVGGKPTDTRPDGSPKYTLPAIQDPNTSQVVVCSFEIIDYFGKIYPETPTLLGNTTALQKGSLEAFRTEVLLPTAPLWLDEYALKLNEPSKQFWSERPTQYPYPSEEELPNVMVRSQKGFEEVASWYPDGSLAGGDTPIYVDIFIASDLQCIRWVHGLESEVWKAFSQWQGGRWEALLEYMKQYE